MELLANRFLLTGEEVDEDVADLRESLLGMGAAADALLADAAALVADGVEATTASLLCLQPIIIDEIIGCA